MCAFGRSKSGVRLREIAQQLPSTIRFSERFAAPLPDLIRAVRQYQLEGIVAKRAGSPYRSGERCGDWLKWRANRGQEFVVGGYLPDHNIVYSILVGYYQGRDFIYACRVRAGLTATSRRLLLPHFEELQIPRCPFKNFPECSEGHWGEGLTAAKRICAAGWILSLLPKSSFSSGRRSIDCVTAGSSESGATRMLAKSRVTALVESSTRVDLF
jgi:hypothetical protein